MPKAIPFLFLVLSSFCLCPFAFALPQQHEAWYQDNDAYRTMYDRYEIGLQRAYDALPEESYKILEKENDAAIDESVKHAEPAGKNAALACAQALAERILIMEEMVSNADSERVAGTPNPLEGFYRLIGRQGDDGYLTISRDGNGCYCLEIAVWQTDTPQSFGWSQAQAAIVSALRRCIIRKLPKKATLGTSNCISPSKAARLRSLPQKYSKKGDTSGLAEEKNSLQKILSWMEPIGVCPTAKLASNNGCEK